MFLRSGAGVLPTSGCHLREIAGYKFSLSYMLLICLNFDIFNIKWDCQEYCMFLNHSPIVKKKKYPKIWFFPGREEENLDVTCFSWLNGVGSLVTWKKQMASSPLGNKKMSKILDRHYGVSPKKLLTECCWSHGEQTQSPVAGTSCVWRLFFGRYLLRLTRIKHSQAISLGQFGPTLVNLGWDVFLLVALFWDPL